MAGELALRCQLSGRQNRAMSLNSIRCECVLQSRLSARRRADTTMGLVIVEILALALQFWTHGLGFSGKKRN